MAAQLTAGDLQYKYSTKAVPGDDPKLKELDSKFFNGTEQYEVLSFINSFLANFNIDGKPLNKQHGLKIERMLQKKPSNIRQRENVKSWVIHNWDNYQ